MSKHTNGPWSCDESGFGTVWAEGGSAICRVDWFSCSDGKANARLIAAAPDLLEALIWMVENDETNEGDTPLPNHNGQSWNEINEYWIGGINRARAAIAKATGEQP